MQERREREKQATTLLGKLPSQVGIAAEEEFDWRAIMAKHYWQSVFGLIRVWEYSFFKCAHLHVKFTENIMLATNSTRCNLNAIEFVVFENFKHF